MRPSEIVKILEDVVSIPFYGVIGYSAGGKVLLHSNEAGYNSIYTLDPNSAYKEKVSTRIVWDFVIPLYRARRVVYIVDVSSGREQGVFYVVDLVKNEEYKLVDMKPLRIIGAADTGKYVYYAGATSEDLAIYAASESGVEKLHVVSRGFAYVTDASEDIVVGSGVLAGNPLSLEVFVYKVSTGEFKVFTPKTGSVNREPVITSRGKVVFESNAYFEERNVLVELDYESGEYSLLALPGNDYQEYSPVEHVLYRDYSGVWLVVGKRDGRTSVFVDGRRVFSPKGFVYGAVLSEGKLYASYSSLTKPDTVVEVDLVSGAQRVLVETSLPASIREGLGDTRFTRVKSYDGIEIPVFTIESRRASKPGPTVIYVHGGPWSEVADSWRSSIVALVASGFHVVAPNFRGSTGYGEWFRRLDIGDPGGGDLEDIVVTTKYARESGLADEIFIMGYSYGGYMTLWALASKPDLFEAGVAGASIADWEEMYELSDAVYKAFIDVLFAGRKDLLRERSPASKAENISRPLCIIHPQNDSRTPLKPVIRLVSRMSELGKKFELHVAPDMGHAINTVEDAIKILLPAVLFLRRFLEKPLQCI